MNIQNLVKRFTIKMGAWRQNYQLVTALPKLVTALPKCLRWSTRKGLRPFLAHFLKENAAGCGALYFPLIRFVLGIVKSTFSWEIGNGVTKFGNGVTKISLVTAPTATRILSFVSFWSFLAEILALSAN